MGLFDGVLGKAAEKMAGGKADLGGLPGGLGGMLSSLGGQAGGTAALAAVMALIQGQGGLGGILEKFKSAGLANIVSSWVGTGANLPVSPAQIQKVFGDAAIGNVAKQMGVAAPQASASIATMLPELVNKLTPKGAIDAGSSDMLSQGLAMLKGQLGK
ncbi:MAG: YidB family protein [Gemmatimonadota bacterium]|nr:YidB family protein [Gemmatimonadota bacterium]